MARTTSTTDTSGDTAESDTAEVQGKVDDETERGHRGVKPSPVPNANYTVGGVTAGKPTPETDDDAAEDAHKAVRGQTRR